MQLTVFDVLLLSYHPFMINRGKEKELSLGGK